MNRQIEEYVDQVISYVDAGEKMKRRLREDLRAHILDAAGAGASDDQIGAAIARMGDPKEMAVELSDLLYDDKREVVRELIEVREELRHADRYEYKSKRTLFGLPLVHIHMSRGYRYGWGHGRVRMGRRPAVAKGIIAIGDVAVGGVAIGGLAAGGLCFGGVALGLMCFGGIGLALLIGLGGIAISGGLAMGGLAIGQFAFGGCALAAQVAVGGYAKAVVAIGGQAVGEYTLSTGDNSLNATMVSVEQARALIHSAYPNLWRPLVDVLVWPFMFH